MSFSCSGKKRTKRIRHRGGADREAYRSCFSSLLFLLGFEPPSPVYPFRRLSALLMQSEQSKSNSHSLIYTQLCIDQKIDPHKSIDGGRVGVLGEGGSKSGYGCQFLSAEKKDFAASASPSRFLWFLSCAVTRKEQVLN